jgi:hypothetical protein
MVTEGIERFNKIVSSLGLYVDEESKKVLQDPERMKTEPVYAFVNEECFTNQDGYILSMIDECVYACLETKDDLHDKEFVFNGCVPAWTYTDEMLCEHLGELCHDYKEHIIKKKLAEIQADFM